MTHKILIIEDDREINSLLSKTLTDGGFISQSAFTGPDGLHLLRTDSFDMVLLDLMLPYKSGDMILKELREFTDIPVLVISAKELTQTKVDLLRLGADDYITKPFDLDELMARVEVNFRRRDTAGVKTGQLLNFQDIMMDPTAGTVIVNGRDLALTATEFKLLELFLENPKKVFSKANLYESIWKEAYSVDDNTLNVHISRLRHKLKEAAPDKDYIETLWGLGYRLTRENLSF